MSSVEIDLAIRYRPRYEESIETKHSEFIKNMRHIGPPLGFEGLSLPPTPDPGDEYIVGYEVRYPIRGLRLWATYNNRRHRYLTTDQASYDDSISILFKNSNKALEYAEILHAHFPKVIEAYKGYLAKVWFVEYVIRYEDNSPVYQKLKKEDPTQLDSRKCIFTLHPATYWDRLLCERALGYGPEEVLRRLKGQVPQVRLLNDGVYTVFNDDKDLSFEDFVAFNDRFKPILGLM